jgi:hypothetical protein
MRFIKILFLSIFLNLNNAFLFPIFRKKLYNGLRESFISKIKKNKEVYKSVNKNNETNLLLNTKPLNLINGFFGMIGPDLNASNVKNIYNLITGNGIIQGVFIDNGNLTFIKHPILTEKRIFEKKYGNISSSIFLSTLLMFLNKIKIIPNMMGVANTALLKVNNSTYALFERDLPYEINIDIEKKNINTIGRLNISDISYMSGHTKKIKDNEILTLEYHILSKKVNILNMDNNFNLLEKYSVKTKYLPIIHDFVITNRGNIIFSDTPFFPTLSFNKIPVKFAKKFPTYFNYLDLNNSNSNNLNINIEYKIDKAFYIFHYSKAIENDTHIDIYASIYDDINFSELMIYGKYRKIVIDKSSKNVNIIKNTHLEIFNLDFPVFYKDYVILRNINNNKINGFISCLGLEIVDVLFFENINICGEPVIIESNGISYLMAFGYEENYDHSYLITIRLYENGTFDRNYSETIINENINIGFHSISVLR